MVRAYYRVSLCALCALAALAGPILFLEDKPRLGYLAGGFVAGLLSWLYLWAVMAVEPHLYPGLQGVIGMCAAVFSWATISLVAVFDVIPHAVQFGMARFDPVWILGGLSPAMIFSVAWWRAASGGAPVLHGLLSALLRFSVPLLGVRLTAQVLGMPRQYAWLYLFTGVMFLVLDALGVGHDLPFRIRGNQHLGAKA